MALVGLAITIIGFVLALLAPGLSGSTGGRLALVLIALAISLGGIIGVINPAYLKNAIWKK